MSVRLSLLIAALMTVCVMPVPADDEDAGPLVTLTAEDTPAAEVAATIEEQTKIRVAVTERTDATITGKMEDVELDAAVAGLAEAIPGSYLRAYIIETETPEEPYTAEVLIQALDETRDWWVQSLNDEEREAMFTAWREQWEQRGQNPGEQQGAEQPGERRGRMMDPLRRLGLPEQHETISIDLQIAGPGEAVADFIAASGYLLLIDPQLEGTVTFSMQEAPLAEVLDGIAEGLGGKWRPFYVVSQPYEMTETERDEMFEARFNQRWAEYWAQSPEERATTLTRRIERMEGMVERAAEGGRGARFMQFLPRMMQRTTEYSLGLTAEQRLEIKPFLQAIARAAAGVPPQ